MTRERHDPGVGLLPAMTGRDIHAAGIQGKLQLGDIPGPMMVAHLHTAPRQDPSFVQTALYLGPGTKTVALVVSCGCGGSFYDNQAQLLPDQHTGQPVGGEKKHAGVQAGPPGPEALRSGGRCELGPMQTWVGSHLMGHQGNRPSWTPAVCSRGEGS